MWYKQRHSVSLFLIISSNYKWFIHQALNTWTQTAHTHTHTSIYVCVCMCIYTQTYIIIYKHVYKYISIPHIKCIIKCTQYCLKKKLLLQCVLKINYPNFSVYTIQKHWYFLSLLKHVTFLKDVCEKSLIQKLLW